MAAPDEPTQTVQTFRRRSRWLFPSASAAGLLALAGLVAACAFLLYMELDPDRRDEMRTWPIAGAMLAAIDPVPDDPDAPAPVRPPRPAALPAVPPAPVPAAAVTPVLDRPPTPPTPPATSAAAAPPAHLLGRSLALPYSGRGVSGQALVFLPAQVERSPNRRWPVLLLLDPGGDAERIVTRWAPAAARLGWILASTPVVRNAGQLELDVRHLPALLDAVEARWPIDRASVVLDGLSGMAGVAYYMALVAPERFRGAIAECGHMGMYRHAARHAKVGTPFYLFTRTEDFNNGPTHDLALALAADGGVVTTTVRPGGHEPMRAPDTEDALQWMQARLAAFR